MTRRITAGPFNRVEGDLEVKLEIEGDRVISARVTSPLYRGFEQILGGKDPRDALVLSPRICGICSVSQSMAAAYALADAQGLEMPLNGELATNLILATENLADHFTHFYLFFMPDFARDVYAEEAWHAEAATRFRAVKGTATPEALSARSAFLNIMGILAGKWPHSLSLQPGGSSRSVDDRDKVRILIHLRQFRRFLESRLFGDRLESIAELESEEQLGDWMQARTPADSDFRHFLHLADALDLVQSGRGSDHFMSYGNYPIAGQRLFASGHWRQSLAPLNPETITEDLSHSLLAGGEAPVHPSEGVTLPDAHKTAGYSWCKAPRLDGAVVETGALARQVVDGHPLIRDLVAKDGGNARNRVIARLLEIARVLPVMERWVGDITAGGGFCNQADLPKEASGMGLVEAARGSLGHWVQIKDSRIANYQIIAPTTWNFSPRDAQGKAGALERALEGAPVRPGESTPVSVQHIVRSFDPCMVCTAH